MKRIILVLMVVVAVAGFAAAQVTSPTQDVLGAHNVYGRGCVACHAPHSGSAANGKTPTANSGNVALWGEDLSPLYGQTLKFGDQGAFPVTLPDYTNGQPMFYLDNYFGIIACLSCHDGNLAKTGMLKGTTVETVTIAGATFNPPTLLGNDGSTLGNYMNDHPVGPNALVGCGGKYDWDCTIDATGKYTFGGTGSSAFLTNYYDVTASGPIGSLISTKSASGGWVSCTTCHDQHSMLYFNAGTATTPNYKPTRFFVRGWYNPGNTNTSNTAAQFCRTCHGGESNEMHGQLSVGTSN